MNVATNRILELSLADLPEDLEAVAEALRDESRGAVLIRADGPAEPRSRIVARCVALCRAIGTPLPEDDGQAYRIITARHREPAPGRNHFADPYIPFPLHVDGTYRDPLPDWFCLAKLLDRSAGGGRTLLLHRDDWRDYAGFAARPEAAEPVVWMVRTTADGQGDIHDADERGVWSPAFSREGVRFLTSPGRAPGPAWVGPPRLAGFFREMEESLARSDGAVAVELRPGDMLLVNNTVYLHGREPFVRFDGLHREIVRVQGSFR